VGLNSPLPPVEMRLTLYYLKNYNFVQQHYNKSTTRLQLEYN